MLSQNNFELSPKVVIGFMDFSGAGCKVLMGHNNRTQLNELSALSFENLNLNSLCKAAPITAFNHDNVSFISINADLSDNLTSTRMLLLFCMIFYIS